MATADVYAQIYTQTGFTAIVKLICPGITVRTCTRLFKSYSQTWRTYHNLTHIHDMLRASEIFQCNLNAEKFKMLQLMIVFHDAVYKMDKPTGWNEAESALFAKSALLTCLSDYHRQWVVCGINATYKHTLDDVPGIWKLSVAALIDLDLMGLGAAPKTFVEESTERVWGEYKRHRSRHDFDRGRRKWAASFLERPRIFTTRQFAHLEKRAQENLRRLADVNEHAAN